MLKRLFLIPLLAVLMLTGCPSDNPGDGPAPTGSAETEKKEEIEKWNLYVDLSNNLETDLNPALQDYLRIFGYSPEYRPADAPEYVADLLSGMVAKQELAREIDRALAKAAGSDSDLDQATYEMSLQLKQLWASLVRARDYYAGDVGDETAARQAHADIYEAYLALEESKVRFWEILGREDAERRKRDIEDMGQRGLTLRPAMLRIIDDGQAVQDYLSGRQVTSATLKNLDPGDCRPLYERLADSIADFDRRLAEVSGKPGEGLNSADLETFSQKAWTALASANQLIEHPRGQNIAEENPEEISGTPEHFARRLGELVDLYNTIMP